MQKIDYKKEYKDLYMPKQAPALIDVPKMLFAMVDGRGDPNTCTEYKQALEILYGISYSIKMSKMKAPPEGYFEYVVPPLEGLWWTENGLPYPCGYGCDKSKFYWTAMIRQPEFVTQAVFEAAKQTLHQKNPALDLTKVRLEPLTEGLCVQVMHCGSYDDEELSINKMDVFLAESGYRNDFSDARRHHEIYLNDPRRTAPENLKTVIRHPVSKAANE